MSGLKFVKSISDGKFSRVWIVISHSYFCHSQKTGSNSMLMPLSLFPLLSPPYKDLANVQLEEGWDIFLDYQRDGPFQELTEMKSDLSLASSTWESQGRLGIWAGLTQWAETMQSCWPGSSAGRMQGKFPWVAGSIPVQTWHTSICNDDSMVLKMHKK